MPQHSVIAPLKRNIQCIWNRGGGGFRGLCPAFGGASIRRGAPCLLEKNRFWIFDDGCRLFATPSAMPMPGAADSGANRGRFPNREYGDLTSTNDSFSYHESRSRSSANVGTGRPAVNTQGAMAERSRVRYDGIEVCTDWWIDCYRNSNKTYESVSGLLKNMEIWILAYQKVCMEVAGSRDILQRSAVFNLHKLRDAVLKGEFTWGGYRQIYIVSPLEKEPIEEMGSTKRKKYLRRIRASPVFQDRVLQEVLLMILEPIFEARFSAKSHGFRPGRNAHTALRVIRRSFPGYIWYIKGDVKEILHGVKPGIMASSMFVALRDRRVLDLIKAGMRTEPPPPLLTEAEIIKKKKKTKKKYKQIKDEEGPRPDPYWLQSFFGFAPLEVEKAPSWGSCGVLSPLLLNIYLDQLDRWMNKKIPAFFKPSSSDSIWTSFDEVLAGPATDQFIQTPNGFEVTRRMDYIRYGTQFLVAVRGSRQDIQKIRSDLVTFCQDRLDLSLSEGLSPPTHISKGVMFMDHIISCRTLNQVIKKSTTAGNVILRNTTGTVLSMNGSLQQCVLHFRKTGFLKGTIDAQPCFRLFHAPQAFTNAQINNLLDALAEWFRYADNRKKVTHFCQYILRSSLAKLYAAKYKLRSRAQVYKIGSGDLSRPIKDKKGRSEHYRRMLKKGLVDEEIEGIEFHKISKAPGVDMTPLQRHWEPEHERLFREVAWLQKHGNLDEQLEQWKTAVVLSPQENMSHITWLFFGGLYLAKDYKELSQPEFTKSPGEVEKIQADKWDSEVIHETEREELFQSAGS